MKFLFLIFCFHLFTLNPAKAQQHPVLQAGDLVFQNLTCGELCQSILAVTPCREGKIFNHCGIIQITDTGIFVLEAIGNKVQQTALSKFMQRNTNPVAFARLKNQTALASSAVTNARQYLDLPYDDAFLPDNDAIYCSELVWASYLEKGKHIFSLEPMTFKAPGTDSTFEGWKNYYQELGQSVPEGILGISPCAIANEPFLEWLPVK